MRFDVAHVSVLRILLTLSRLMDQKVETVGIRIVPGNSLKMIFVKEDHLAHSFGKFVQ